MDHIKANTSQGCKIVIKHLPPAEPTVSWNTSASRRQKAFPNHNINIFHPVIYYNNKPEECFKGLCPVKSTICRLWSNHEILKANLGIKFDLDLNKNKEWTSRVTGPMWNVMLSLCLMLSLWLILFPEKVTPFLKPRHTQGNNPRVFLNQGLNWKTFPFHIFSSRFFQTFNTIGANTLFFSVLHHNNQNLLVKISTTLRM